MEFISSIFTSIGEGILSLLPTSPLQGMMSFFESTDLSWLSFLNWLIPISTFIAIGEVWLACITVFHIYSIILRWINAID